MTINKIKVKETTSIDSYSFEGKLEEIIEMLQDWEWDDYAEEGFVEWFNSDYGSPYSLRSEYFFGDTKICDEKTRQDMMHKWLHSAYLTGYNMGRLSETKVGLTNND